MDIKIDFDQVLNDTLAAIDKGSVRFLELHPDAEEGGKKFDIISMIAAGVVTTALERYHQQLMKQLEGIHSTALQD